MIYLQDPDLTLYQGDALETLRGLEDESVHCVVTSPPYWGLRDYGAEGQLGLEPTPELYVEHMVEVFREVRRVLRKDGTCWLNIGDSYSADHAQQRKGGQRGLHAKIEGAESAREGRPPSEGLKPKNLCLIPARLSLALQADGWWVRSEVIWDKPNPMPESVTDRPTCSHEKLFLLTKSKRYYYDADAVREPYVTTHAPGSNIATTQHYHEENGGNAGLSAHLGSVKARLRAENVPQVETLDGSTGEAPRGPDGRRDTHIESRDGSIQHRSGERWPNQKKRRSGNVERKHGHDVGVPRYHEGDVGRSIPWEEGENGRNLRTVWRIATKPSPDPHFAVFPPELPRRCIRAGTSAKGCCPECGAGWRRLYERWELDESRPQAARAMELFMWSELTDEHIEAIRAAGITDVGQGAALQSGSGRNTERVLELAAEAKEVLGGYYREFTFARKRPAGWFPGCDCGGVDLEVIATPTGEGGEDTTSRTGRKGLGRQRSAEGGTRPITRYEQQRYAEQLKASPARRKMEAECGEAFAHYVRTDRAGARPVPPELLESWIANGWLERVEIPEHTAAPPIPCTVLDPFAGSGTTALVAREQGRHCILIELSPDYCGIIEKRTQQLSLEAAS